MSIKDLFVYNQEAARHQWVREQLASLPPGGKILDAGCGPQIYRLDCAHLEYRAQDFGNYDGAGDGSGLQIDDFSYGRLDYRCDIWSIPEVNATFDAVICTEVLEHVPYPRETILELARLLKPGGILLLTVPYACLPHMSPYFFSSGYSVNFYEHVFAQGRLSAEQIVPCGNGFFYVGQELLRMRTAFENPLVRFCYLVLTAPFLAMMRLIGKSAAGDRANNLPFGYFIRAKRL